MGERKPEQSCLNRNTVDCIAGLCRRSIKKLDIFVFSSTFVLTFMVHMYMFTNKFINHDDIAYLYHGTNLLSSGRWLLYFTQGISGFTSSPWLNAVLGALYFAAAAVLIMRILRVSRFLPALLISACIVSFPTVTSTYAYMFCSGSYLLALLLSVVSAHLIQRKKWPAIALGGVAVALSMGIYQSYFPLTAALLVFSMLVDVIDSRFSSFKEFIAVGLKYAAGLAFGMILYFVILRICLKVNNVELIDYQGISSMGIVTFSQLIDRISAAYKNFFYFYCSAVFHSFFKYIAAAAFLFSAVAALAIIFQRRLYKSFSAIIEIIILVALIPLACDLVYVMAGEFTVHLVMVYPMLLPLIFPAVISERICFSGILKSRSGFVSLALTLALLLTQLACAYEFVLIDNRAYFYMDMTYKNVYAFMTKLTAKIELQDDFSSSTPVALIGKINMDSNVPATPGMTGVFTGNSVANIYTRKHLLYNVLASRYDYVDADTEEQIKQTDEFEEMPCYPNAGSIKTINGVIVVKFSD